MFYYSSALAGVFLLNRRLEYFAGIFIAPIRCGRIASPRSPHYKTYHHVCHGASSEALTLPHLKLMQYVSTPQQLFCYEVVFVTVAPVKSFPNKANQIGGRQLSIHVSFSSTERFSLNIIISLGWLMAMTLKWYVLSRTGIGHYSCMCAASSRKRLSWQPHKWLYIHSQKSNVLQLEPAALPLSVSHPWAL